MRRAFAFPVLAIAACWSSPAPPTTPTPPVPVTTPPPPSSTELRAVVRIDAAPDASQLQRVWLELAGGERYVIDDRARELWRGFADAEVIATGHCYRASGQAIAATHFRVERLRFARPPVKLVRLLSIGPSVELEGEVFEHAWPAGSKLAGSPERRFRSGDTVYRFAGGERPELGPATVRARVVEPNRAFAAGTDDPQLWIDAARADDHAPEPAIPCP